MGNRFTLTVCDDILEEELTSLKKDDLNHPTNNDFLLQELKSDDLEDSLKDERRIVLYRYDNSARLPDDVLDSTLGKKRHAFASNSELERAVMLEYVRDYVVQEKDQVKETTLLPFQSSDFIVISQRNQLFSHNGTSNDQPI